MDNKYSHKIEEDWQKKWEESGIYKDYSKKKKFYALDMFPYPSGAGLHVGHPKGYIATDVYSRFMMLNGYSVLHPMGWDAFGLPAENYAIANKIHPKIAVEKNIATFKGQLKKFGFTYDWDREINTTDPGYYKWTQWIFLRMFERGLACESHEPINWCPKCKTGLANEDLENGLCERCGTQVEQKKMRQWVLKMTDYADRLLEDLEKQDLDWEESIILQQKNWIGRSEGAEFSMKITPQPPLSGGQNKESPHDKGGEVDFIKVYTTRLDTVFGMTYAVVAPEHEIIKKLKDKIENYSEVEKYIIAAQNKTEMERTQLAKEKTGVELKGIKAVNPFNNAEVPVFVADYVLGHYGTGAVMAVPAHDERDFEFAKKYGLPIKKVILPPVLANILRNAEDLAMGVKSEIRINNECFVLDGELINSDRYSKLTSEQARKEMTAWLEKNKLGKKKVNYKMRDWVFSRQRYWGEPIPIVHCEKCGAIGVPEKDLPVRLPEVESYEPTGTGEGPLASIEKWVNTKCPKCSGLARRETNTMPQWAGSSWYYLRYIDNKNNKNLVGKKEEKEWMPVDLYVGGAEHATRHLLYARFWHKFLYDIKAVSTKEPFKRLVHVGLINAEDGRKMSKRWNNVINPDEIIEQYGADSIRLYEMFMGPFTQNIAWSTEGVRGVRRFLDRTWDYLFGSLRAFINEEEFNQWVSGGYKGNTPDEVKVLLNKTIKKVTDDIENFRFNTAISQLMIFRNSFCKTELVPNKMSVKVESTWSRIIEKSDFEKFLLLLAPFSPHFAEELWHRLGNKESIFKEKWPKYDENLIKDEMINLVIQVNSKLRDTISVAADISETQAKKIALASEKVEKWILGKEVVKVIFVKGKLVNIVVK
jgi:leucyl-tRNA synthetase